MKAIIQIDVPNYQIGQEVSIYFKDTMMIKGIVQEPCGDAISRQAVIDGINEYFHDEYYQRTSIQDCRDCLIEDVIKDIPPVTPQSKTGLGDILIADQCECENCIHEEMCKWKEERHGQECAYMQKPKTGHCKDCKYFEYDSVAKVDGVPLIVAHEICSRWGNGCKTREDGYCFLFEPQESEDKE